MYLRSKRKIRSAVMQAFDGALQCREGITLERFLCAMHFVFGRRLLNEFDDPAAFLRMEKEIFPEGKVGLVTRWRRRRRLPSEEFVFIRFDERLTRILWTAIRISRAGKYRSTGLGECMAALCLDKEAVDHLKKTRGLAPRQYFEMDGMP